MTPKTQMTQMIPNGPIIILYHYLYDIKLLDKVLALRPSNLISYLVHKDQVGCITLR